MNPAKADILVVLFAYSGNGGVASTIPQLVFWYASTFHKMKADPRVGRIGTLVLCDTPITMTRNQALATARDGGFDFLLMLDSDNEPDGAIDTDPTAKPFWDEAFDLAYNRKIAGKETIVAAPYCGPPPEPGQCDGGEVPYLFQWENNESDVASPGFKLRLISRHEAALMRGIHRVAALPTGCCLLSVGVIDGMKPPFFYYEFDREHAHKNSTEDVVFTRNASLHWQLKGGDNICFATCDSWAYHHKTKVVGRPTIMPVEMISEDFRQAVMDGHNAGDRLIDVNPEIKKNLNHVMRGTPEVAQAVVAAQDEKFIPLPAEPKAVDPAVYADDDFPPEPSTPIVHRSVGGQMVTTDERWPLTEQDAAAISKIVEQFSGTTPRILALNVGLGDNFAALAQAAWMLNSSALFMSPRGVNREAYAKNCEAAGLSHAMIPEVEPDPSEFDNQELDLLWVGHPDVIADSLNAIRSWWSHVKPNGLLAGIGLGTNLNVNRMLQAIIQSPGIFDACEVVSLEAIEGSSAWMIRKPQPVAEAATEAV